MAATLPELPPWRPSGARGGAREPVRASSRARSIGCVCTDVCCRGAWPIGMARPFVAMGNRLIRPGADGASPLEPVHSCCSASPPACVGSRVRARFWGWYSPARRFPDRTRTPLCCVCLRGRCRYLIGRGHPCRRTGICGAEENRSGRSEWVRRALGVAVLLGVVANRVRLGQHRAHAPVARRNESLGAIAHRRDRSGGGTVRGGPSRGGRPCGGGSFGRTSQSLGRLYPSRGSYPRSAERPVAQFSAFVAGEPAGKVVLVDFWTYSCINCLRALPYVKGLVREVQDYGFTVLGVHAPEFAFEKDAGNCAPRRRRLGRGLSGRARQSLRDLAGLQQSVLARSTTSSIRRDACAPTTSAKGATMSPRQ